MVAPLFNFAPPPPPPSTPECCGDNGNQSACVQNGSFCTTHCQCPGGWYCDGYYSCWDTGGLDLCGCYPCTDDWPCGTDDACTDGSCPTDPGHCDGTGYNHCVADCGSSCACYSARTTELPNPKPGHPGIGSKRNNNGFRKGGHLRKPMRRGGRTKPIPKYPHGGMHRKSPRLAQNCCRGYTCPTGQHCIDCQCRPGGAMTNIGQYNKGGRTKPVRKPVKKFNTGGNINRNSIGFRKFAAGGSSYTNAGCKFETSKFDCERKPGCNWNVNDGNCY